jgi:hypothetical protein
MKNFAIKLVWFTTAYLLVYIVLAEFNFAFPLIFAMCITGQGLTVFMVYKVLTDKYTTNKTFKDWYEDRPVNTLED